MRVAGMILAGGRSARMGREKALAPLRGRPLIAHVIARFAPQVACLAINANGDPARFAAFGLPVQPDGAPDRPGPLAGVACALAYARQTGADAVAVVPADAPFLPEKLVERLKARLDDGVQAVCARLPAGIEPLFSLWRIDVEPTILAALAQGEGAPRAALFRLAHRFADFAVGEEQAFANLNTPEDLARAEAAADS